LDIARIYMANLYYAFYKLVMSMTRAEF
jgi:hypothetical protein